MRESFLRHIGWVVLLGVVAVACASTVDGAGSLQIRIANRSNYDFEGVEVTFPSDKIDYGRLRKGAVTDYRQVKTAYSYARVEVSIGERTLTFKPQDFMEPPLMPGRYTYALWIDESGNQLKIDLVPE